jgi:hypothetical protein
VDCIDLLDPDYVRVPASRRTRLAPVVYSPLPNVDSYKRTLSLLSHSMDPFSSEHAIAGLQNLMQPVPLDLGRGGGWPGGSSGSGNGAGDWPLPEPEQGGGVGSDSGAWAGAWAAPGQRACLPSGVNGLKAREVAGARRE